MTETVAKKSLIDYFSALDDPCQAWKVEYPLPEMMLLVLCATLAGAESFVETTRWGRMKLAFLRQLLPFKPSIPSHDALNDVMNGLDAGMFSECFSAWVESLHDTDPEIVAIQPALAKAGGRTSRRRHDRGKDRAALHLVSACATTHSLMLG